MEFISHAVKNISQLKDICKDGYLRASENLIQEGKFVRKLSYDYEGDSYVGYTKHVMCGLGFGYINNGCPAAILFKSDIINSKSVLYPLPFKYQFFLGIAKILWNEQRTGKKDWKSVIKNEKAIERKGFVPFEEYMNYFFTLDGEPCFDNSGYKGSWGPSVYSSTFIKNIIPKLKKSQIKQIKSSIETIKGNKIKKHIESVKDEKLPYEIMLGPKLNLDKAYGFAVKKAHSKKVKFLSKFNKPIIWV